MIYELIFLCRCNVAAITVMPHPNPAQAGTRWGDYLINSILYRQSGLHKCMHVQ